MPSAFLLSEDEIPMSTLLNAAEPESGVTDSPEPIQLTVEEVQQMLPHRYPFALVDRITELIPGKRAIGIKNVTFNEPHFQGHFPGKPIMPGVLIVEAMAQVGGIILKHATDAEGLCMLAGINNVRFRRPVVPGDQIVLTVELLNKRKRFGKMHGVATVDGHIVCEGEVLFSIVDV